MKFTVVSTAAADDELAALYNRAADPAAVTDAANEIDRHLKLDAHLQGQPLGKFRYLVVPPLAVLYFVSELDRLVTIISFKRV